MKPLSPYFPYQLQYSFLQATMQLVYSAEDAPLKYGLQHHDRNSHRRIAHRRDICLYLHVKLQFSIPH
jgi:hypothetical protein